MNLSISLTRRKLSLLSTLALISCGSSMLPEESGRELGATGPELGQVANDLHGTIFLRPPDDADVCSISNGGCSPDATCTSNGVNMVCACNAGYSGDGRTCTDINECLIDNGGCPSTQDCINTPGSHQCLNIQTCKDACTGELQGCMADAVGGSQRGACAREYMACLEGC